MLMLLFCSLQKKYQICIDTGDAFHIHSKKRNVDIGDDLMITVIAVFSRVALIGRARSKGGQTGQLPSLPSTSRGASTKNTHTHTQPFNGLWYGTIRVGQYQKKHSPNHTHPDHQTSFIIFLHLQRSMASSLFSLRA